MHWMFGQLSAGIGVNATSVSPFQSVFLQPPKASQRAQFASSSSHRSANRCAELPVVWNQGLFFLYSFVLCCWILFALSPSPTLYLLYLPLEQQVGRWAFQCGSSGFLSLLCCEKCAGFIPIHAAHTLRLHYKETCAVGSRDRCEVWLVHVALHFSLIHASCSGVMDTMESLFWCLTKLCTAKKKKVYIKSIFKKAFLFKAWTYTQIKFIFILIHLNSYTFIY